jgi:poly-gamma-glutamate synthesis protein (capsule biosynthesis protein)
MAGIRRRIRLFLLCCSISILVAIPGKVYATDSANVIDQQEEIGGVITDDQLEVEGIANTDDQSETEATEEIKEYTGGLKFASDKLSLQEGDHTIYQASLTEENLSGESIVYKSSNKKIVTITQEGEINAIHYGEATITAVLGKEKATCKVTVSKDLRITISAAGDVTLSSDIKQPASVNFFSVYNKQKQDSYFFENVKSIFDQDDITIVNFEGTLSDRGSRVEKQWAFRGKPSYINILTEGSIEAVAFANNHVRDYGEVSYTDTIASFDKAGIIYSSDDRIGIYETKGIKIGMISIQETSRSDSKTILRQAIKVMKKQEYDLLVVSFHWGIERTSSITRTQKELSRIAIDEGGADLVLGHHPHVLQPIEKYKDAYIVYSLGNFCFGGNTNPPDKDTMIYQQTFTFHNDELVPSDEISIIPCSVSSVTGRNNYQPTPSVGKEKQRILKKFNSYCKQFGLAFDKKGKLITE